MQLRDHDGMAGRLKVKEAEIQRQVLGWLEANNYAHWRSYTGPVVRGGGTAAQRLSKNPTKGFPDICVISKHRPGRLMTFELKAAKGRQSPEQVEWQRILGGAGVPYAVVRSLEEFIGKVNEFEWGW